jgi:hypothetical protein
VTKFYTFDCQLQAAFTVEAESREEAERIISGPLDAAEVHVFEDGEVELEGEVSLIPGTLTFAEDLDDQTEGEEQ